MVKGRAVPRRAVVTLLTGRREAGLDMVRIGRAVEILHMARRAVGRGPHELPVDVALRAGNVHVRAYQLESRELIVIESGRIPRAGVVADPAGRRETSLCMRRIVGLVKVRHVAAVAGGGRIVEFPARVAGSAIERGVRARQREAGELRVIELRADPVVHRVARLAGRRQIQSDVVDSDRLGTNKVLLMAGETLRRQTLELAHGSAFVAGVAVHSGVRADQREPVEVLIDLLNRNMPAPDRMALLAVCAHLPLVDIGVAVGALRADIGKDHLGVALRAGHTFMQTAQRVFGGVVIEFRNCSDRLPTA